MKISKTILISLFALSLIIPLSVIGQVQIQQPENLEEAKQMGEKALEVTKKEGPGIMENVFTKEVIPIWKQMFYWAKSNLWDNWIGSWLKNFWNDTTSLLKGEVSERKPVVKEEFQKEKQELKNEAPSFFKNLWGKLKELVN
jgi:hypothetical protein